MNRPIDRLIDQAGFEMARLQRFLMPKSPRVLAEIYRGVAVAPFFTACLFLYGS